MTELNEQMQRLNEQPHGGLMAPLTHGMLHTIITDIADVALQEATLNAAINAAREIVSEQELCHVPAQARQVYDLLHAAELADCICGRRFAHQTPEDLTLFVAKQWLWTQVTARVRFLWQERERTDVPPADAEPADVVNHEAWSRTAD